MRWTLGVAALATVTMCSGSMARAADSLTGQQIVIKGGVTRPTDGDVKAVGNDWFTYGAEYQFGDPDAKAVNGIELLYTKKSDTVTNVGTLGIPTDYSMFSLMLNHKIRRPDPDGTTAGKVFFYGAGVGVDFIRVKMDDPNPGGQTIDDKSTVLGGNLFAGYEFSSNVQLELKYQIPFKKVNDTKFDGLQLLAGIKF
ncbi:MAG TPA: outer membrane beta-barrel protein [Armatimonadota bacterium]|jgi:hypothetical protein